MGGGGCTYCLHLRGEDGNEDAQKQQTVVSKKREKNDRIRGVQHAAAMFLHRIILLHVVEPPAALPLHCPGNFGCVSPLESLLQHDCLT